MLYEVLIGDQNQSGRSTAFSSVRFLQEYYG